MMIGKRLRELRKARGLSQGDFQDLTGLPRTYLSRIECGHSMPNLTTLERFATALGVSLYELFYEGQGKCKPPQRAARVTVQPSISEDPSERRLWKHIRKMNEADRKLLVALAQQMAKRGERRGR